MGVGRCHQSSPERDVLQQRSTRVREPVRAISDQEVLAIHPIESFSPERRRHHWYAMSERFEDLDAGASSEPDGHSADVGARELSDRCQARAQ